MNRNHTLMKYISSFQSTLCVKIWVCEILFQLILNFFTFNELMLQEGYINIERCIFKIKKNIIIKFILVLVNKQLITLYTYTYILIQLYIHFTFHIHKDINDQVMILL